MVKLTKESQSGSVIKCECDNRTLIWKHPVENFNLGSQLIVREGQEAVFFRDGQALDLFGPGHHTLTAQSIPLLNQACRIPPDPNAAFHSKLYYVNLATQSGVRWGTDSKVRVSDPMSGLHVELGASGSFGIRVADSRKLLLKLAGTTGGLEQELLGIGSKKGFFRAMVMTEVKGYLAQVIRENEINILDVDAHLITIANALREKVNLHLSGYGVTMPEFFVANIVLPDDDPSFKLMKELHDEEVLRRRKEEMKKSEAEAAGQRKTAEAQTEAQIKIIEAKGKAEAYRIQAAAEAEEMRIKGYTYNQETVRQVGLETMKALKEGISDCIPNGLKKFVVIGSMIDKMLGKKRKSDKPVIPAELEPNAWDCQTCGTKNITGNFCPECGAQRPEPIALDAWDCPSCGAKNITSKFCTTCGTGHPEPAARG